MPDLDIDQDALLPGEEFVFLLDSGHQPPPIMPDLDSDQDALLPGEEFVFLLDSGQQPPPASQSVPVNDIICDGEPYKMSTLDLCQDVSDLGSEPKQDLKLENPSLCSSHIRLPRANSEIPDEDDEKGQLRNSFYVGEIKDDIFNTFSSGNSPQPQKTDIQCVSKITLHLPSQQTMQTSALLDTGSVLNFVSRALIEKLGSPNQKGAGRAQSRPFQE